MGNFGEWLTSRRSIGDTLISVSGARADLLAQAPSDRPRFIGTGSAILFTSVIAGFSFTFALATVLGVFAPIALLGGIFWASGIMSLDRWLVTSLPGPGQGRARLAVPRVLLAILLGAVISTPVVLQIFQHEIRTEIVQIQRERGDTFANDQTAGALTKEITKQQAVVDDLDKVIGSQGSVPLDPAKDPEIQFLTGQLDQETKKRDDLYADWQCQLLGIPSTNLPKCVKGNGDLAKAAEKEYRSAVSQVKATKKKLDDRRTKISSNDGQSDQERLTDAQNRKPDEQARLQQLKDQRDELTQAFGQENKGSAGLLLQIEALDRATGGNSSLALVRFVLFLLFLTIECLPLVLKLMQKPGLYEELAELSLERERERARERIEAQQLGEVQDVPITQIWEDDTARWSDDQPETEVFGGSRYGSPMPSASSIMADDDELLRDMDDAVDVQATPAGPSPSENQTRWDAGFHVDDDR